MVAARAVHRDPVFIKSGLGSKIFDVDGNEYIDYVCSWGPAILGHAHPYVLEKVKKALKKGLSFGAPTKKEYILAEMINEAMPVMEQVRLVNSGTEATMSAIRLARGYTNKDLILKFTGCYHGHSDALLVKSGSGLLTDGYQDSNGITDGVVKDGNKQLSDENFTLSLKQKLEALENYVKPLNEPITYITGLDGRLRVIEQSIVNINQNIINNQVILSTGVFTH